jgi:integrase
MKLTEREITQYRPPQGKADHIIFDENLAGFGLRYRDGRRVWLFQYAFVSDGNRVNRRMTFGTFPDLPPAKARSIAADLAAKVRLGQDPAADKAVKRSEAGHTFGRLVAGYLEQKRNELRPRSYVEVERYLDVYAKSLHGLPASGVDLKKVAAFLDTVAKDCGAVSANRARGALSALFVWAMRKGLHDNNPVILSESRPEQSRDRVLTDDEIAAIWNNTGDIEYADIIRLLILTGQRAGEIAGLRWSEIDFERGLISLPGERTKNGRAHEIPMSPAVVTILEARPKGGEFVFGRGTGGFSGWGRSKQRLDAALAVKLGNPLPAWVIHDLRRTAATRMIDLGELPHVVEAILNHVSGHKGGVAGIYNRSLYKNEKAKALAVWAEHVLAIARGDKGSNVTPIHRAKKSN